MDSLGVWGGFLQPRGSVETHLAMGLLVVCCSLLACGRLRAYLNVAVGMITSRLPVYFLSKLINAFQGAFFPFGGRRLLIKGSPSLFSGC